MGGTVGRRRGFTRTNATWSAVQTRGEKMLETNGERERGRVLKETDSTAPDWSFMLEFHPLVSGEAGNSWSSLLINSIPGENANRFAVQHKKTRRTVLHLKQGEEPRRQTAHSLHGSTAGHPNARRRLGVWTRDRCGQATLVHRVWLEKTAPPAASSFLTSAPDDDSQSGQPPVSDSFYQVEKTDRGKCESGCRLQAGRPITQVADSQDHFFFFFLNFDIIGIGWGLLGGKKKHKRLNAWILNHTVKCKQYFAWQKYEKVKVLFVFFSVGNTRRESTRGKKDQKHCFKYTFFLLCLLIQ